jgi:hypothetical protein
MERAALSQRAAAAFPLPLARGSAAGVSHDALSTSFVTTLNVMRRTFNEIDTDADGILSFEEMDAFLIAASVEMSSLATHQLLDLIDTERDDGVTFAEFSSWWAEDLIGVELPRAKEEASAAASVKESRGEKVTRCEGGVGDGVAAAPRRTSNRETAVADDDGEADESMCCDASDAGVATCAVA